jgi:hypothetical protein
MERTWENRWQKADDGSDVMPEIQSRYLDWLLSDVRVPPTQIAWCSENGVDDKTPPRWKKDPRFLKAWESRSVEKNVSIERVQAVIDVIYEAATNGDLKAAEQYMRYVERILPPRMVQRDPDDLTAMSDEDLLALAQAVASTPDAETGQRVKQPVVEKPLPALNPVGPDALRALLDG